MDVSAADHAEHEGGDRVGGLRGFVSVPLFALVVEVVPQLRGFGVEVADVNGCVADEFWGAPERQRVEVLAGCTIESSHDSSSGSMCGRAEMTGAAGSIPA